MPSEGARMEYLPSNAADAAYAFDSAAYCLLLIANVVYPGPRFGQVVLLLDDLQVRRRNFLCVARIVESVAADRFRVDGIGLLLFDELVLRVLESSPSVVDLSFGDRKVLMPGLRPEFLEHGARGFGLRLLLLSRCPLHGIVDGQQQIALVDLCALCDQDLRDRSGDFRIDIDVLALGLHAFNDPVGVNPARRRGWPRD